MKQECPECGYSKWKTVDKRQGMYECRTCGYVTGIDMVRRKESKRGHLNLQGLKNVVNRTLNDIKKSAKEDEKLKRDTHIKGRLLRKAYVIERGIRHFGNFKPIKPFNY